MSTTSVSTVQTDVYHTIRDGLMSGRWRPGERLPELKLAAELGVNRNPVREALLSLASEGLVERRAKFGAEVVALDRATLVNLYQLREAIEGMAARLAAARIEPIELVHLEHENDLLRRLSLQPHRYVAELAEADNRFHRMLVSASANTVLLQVWDSQRLRAVSARNVIIGRDVERLARRRDPNIAIAAHQKILHALKRRDANAADAMARAHIATALRALLDVVDEPCGKTSTTRGPRHRRKVNG